MTEYVIASDGTKCIGDLSMTAAMVREKYEEDLLKKHKFNLDMRYLNVKRRITPKHVRLFYQYWTMWSGYGNTNGDMKWIYNLDTVKTRIMHTVVRLANRQGWATWRNENILYIETPQGQCSWHLGKKGRIKEDTRKWFEKFPERRDLKWSGIRNSDIVIRRILGEKSADRPLPNLVEGRTYYVLEYEADYFIHAFLTY
jgi:hypothetical protein